MSANEDFALKARNLETIKKALDDATSVGAGFWLSYLFLLFYLAVAAGAVTHVDLLLENPVRLPFLNVELPLKAFFLVAPILFVVTHIFTLAKLRLLADKARHFDEELCRQIRTDASRERVRLLLPNNIFVQFLAGPHRMRDTCFGKLLELMGWVSLVIAPVLLLLLLQLQFLPYHDSLWTWSHRAALLLDLLLLRWLSPTILARGNKDARVPILSVASSILSFVAFVFAWFVATFPGEWEALPLAQISSLEPKFATEWIFGGINARQEMISKKWFYNRLVFFEFNIYEALRLDDPKKLDWKDHAIILRERNLVGAWFERAKLGKADLLKTNLRGAMFLGAQLQGARLDQAQLQESSFFGAQLQRASLIGTQLQGAALDAAQLHEAFLYDAHLQGASLSGADLKGAALISSELQGARLDDAHLEGATLRLVRLNGASLIRTQLQGARFLGAELDGANLSQAYLWRASWENTKLNQIYARDLRWSPEAFVRAVSVPWTEKLYEAMRNELTQQAGEMGERTNFQTLECKEIENLAPCDPKAPVPTAVETNQARLEGSLISEDAYQIELAKILQTLICDGGTNAIHILHGIRPSARLAATGPNAAALAGFILSKNCPVSSALTKEDRAWLLDIKQWAEQTYLPAKRGSHTE